MAGTFTRQTAQICRLKDIADGAWVQNESPEPSGIQTGFGLLSRVNVLGVVLEKPNTTSIVIDDGSHKITARTFDPMPALEAVAIGDLVLVIGKPREYNGLRYITLEICKKLQNKNWIEYRKKELNLFYPEEAHPKTTEIVVEGNPMTVLINTIRDLDEGTGVLVDEILAKVTLSDGEKLLNVLIEEGEVFEIKPGRVKVLE